MGTLRAPGAPGSSGLEPARRVLEGLVHRGGWSGLATGREPADLPFLLPGFFMLEYAWVLCGIPGPYSLQRAAWVLGARGRG